MIHINQGEKFQHIWEFRRGDDDGETSDDSKSMNRTGELGHEKPQLDLVLRENDEETVIATYQKPDGANNVAEVVKPSKRKTKARPIKTKKTNEVKKTKSKSVSTKRRKVTRNSSAKQDQMFEDLKIFAGSLIDQLKVAREQMFARMQEETKKLMASRPTQKRVVLANESITLIQKGAESSVEPQNQSEGERGMTSNVHMHSKADEVSAGLEQATDVMTNKQLHECIEGRLPLKGRINLGGKNTDHPQYLTLPTFVPTPQAQRRMNGIHLDGGSPVVAPEDKGDGMYLKQLDPRIFYHGVPAFQPELFRSFPHLTPKGFGFVDQNSQGLGIGSSMGGSSNISNQMYSASPFQNHSGAGLNVMFSGGNVLSSEAILRSNVLQRNGDSAQSRSMNDSQFFPKFA